MNPDRKYVVIRNEHKGIAGSLLFWGKETEDNQKRSFGGYTNNFNECEKYSIDDLGSSNYNFPIYSKAVDYVYYNKVEDFAIEIDKLPELGYRPMLIWYR